MGMSPNEFKGRWDRQSNFETGSTATQQRKSRDSGMEISHGLRRDSISISEWQCPMGVLLQMLNNSKSHHAQEI